ncbi:MAG: hypothetical protein WC812_04790 [Candidatus Pacearchaeota archaeon]|jgi:hypothetical protein
MISKISKNKPLPEQTEFAIKFIDDCILNWKSFSFNDLRESLEKNFGIYARVTEPTTNYIEKLEHFQTIKYDPQNKKYFILKKEMLKV